MNVTDADTITASDGMTMLQQQCRTPSAEMCYGQCPACAAPGSRYYGMSEAVFQASRTPGALR